MTQDLLGVVDVGSNTIRLLVGRLHDGRVDSILDESEFVRLGKGVDKAGRLLPERMDAAIGAISQLLAKARERGVASVALLATSAVRDASNGRDLARRVREELGVELQIITGDREAVLTFEGATMGLELQDGTVVCDLGGGSAEFIHSTERSIDWAVSKQLGSGRLTERFVHDDPLSDEDLAAVRAHVMSELDGSPPASADQCVFTGGTATHLVMLSGKTGAIVELTDVDIDRAVELVRKTPASSLVERYGMRPERAQVLPAGIAAIGAVVEYYEVRRVIVTQSGIREGMLLHLWQSSGGK